MIEVTVRSLGLDKMTNSPVLILQDRDGDRVLPIWIGPGEASAIAMRLGDVSFSRPLTHDLLVSVIDALGGTLRRVDIRSLEEGTYFATLVIDVGDRSIEVDARPSDSIALALRADADIFAADALMSELEIGAPDELLPVTDEGTEAVDPGDTAAGKPLTAEELQEYLRTLRPEDFGRFKP